MLNGGKVELSTAMPGTIFCATSLLPGQKFDARAPRAQQSAAARKLLGEIGIGLAASAATTSHSRGAIAVAAGEGEGEGLSLGIDIEWMRLDRPFASLSAFLLGQLPQRQLGPAEFYRAWTFYEAYFKAFQRVPPRAGLRRVMEQGSGEGARLFPDDTHLLQFRVAKAFQVSLVWRASKRYAVRHLPDLCGLTR